MPSTNITMAEAIEHTKEVVRHVETDVNGHIQLGKPMPFDGFTFNRAVALLRGEE